MGASGLQTFNLKLRYLVLMSSLDVTVDLTDIGSFVLQAAPYIGRPKTSNEFLEIVRAQLDVALYNMEMYRHIIEPRAFNQLLNSYHR